MQTFDADGVIVCGSHPSKGATDGAAWILVVRGWADGSDASFLNTSGTTGEGRKNAAQQGKSTTGAEAHANPAGFNVALEGPPSTVVHAWVRVVKHRIPAGWRVMGDASF